MVYDNKVQGIRVLEKELLPLFSKKNKDKPNKKTKASKSLRTGKGVGTDLFPVHVTFSNYDLLTRASN